MVRKPGKVVVAMSGGVDSSVAACLLVEQGYDVMGLFMRVGAEEESTGANGAMSSATGSLLPVPSSSHLPPEARADKPLVAPSRAHQGCCSASDAADARYVAGILDIPFYALNFEEEFEEIIDYFADEYARGRTPNPCVMCNDRMKFGKLMDYADAVGAEHVATGHYARIGTRDGGRTLLRGLDRQKDQSYVLFGLRRAVLDRALFPIGELTKPQVREIAARYDLPNRDKPDSVEICFVPDRNYARVVRERRPDGFVEGDVVDEAGHVVGRHKGIGQYTVGQRRGLGIAAGKPIYVTGLDVLNNRVTVGDDAALLRGSLVADRVNYLVDGLGETFPAQVKIRYLHTAVPATVHKLNGGKVRIVFDEPQRAITPGQAVVFYDGDLVLGGAWIEHAVDAVTIQNPSAGAGSDECRMANSEDRMMKKHATCEG